MKYFLGIDTSNYRTSVAIANENGEIVAQIRRLLPVANGERGLRQSDAVFAHTKALPELIEKIGKFELEAVGYSAFPRDTEGSYMPCFLAGESVARSVAALNGIPVYKFSHQAGHLMAACYSSALICPANRQKFDFDKKFLAFHLSGGTTEALLFDKGKISILGATKDLNAGQVIDRVGVAMGLPFPAGEEMEKLAENMPATKGLKICVKGFDCNLSGIENLAMKQFQLNPENVDNKKYVAAFTLDTVSKTVIKMTSNLLETYPDLPILYAGGVMACKRIKNQLAEKFDCAFALPEYSGDNAAGTALLCRQKHFNVTRNAYF